MEAPERAVEVLAEAQSGATWRASMGLPEPSGRLAAAMQSMQQAVSSLVVPDGEPMADALLARHLPGLDRQGSARRSGAPGAARHARGGPFPTTSRRSRVAARVGATPDTVRDIRVLLVEDDARLADVTARSLEAAGLVVDRAARGAQALTAFDEARYDVTILDAGLPDIDGFEVCRRMRAADVSCPVLMLTARTQVQDRVDGLDAGADDYLGKPFEVAELLARVRALLRRGPVRAAPVLQVGGLRLDPGTHEVWRDDESIDLSVREFSLLEAFMRHPGQVLSRDTLLDQAWPAGADQRSNVVEVCIRNLREKIDRPFGVRSVENVRGAGYRLRRDGGR